jgi:diguanylate cyclase (GGDEF)-like protein
VAGLVYLWIIQSNFFPVGGEIAGILFGMAVFAALGHLMGGILRWLGYRESFRKSGAFELFPLILDVSLLYFGASLSIVWKSNPLALLLLVIPTYMLFSALRIPALERKSELDSKTGLFNHAYFKKHLDSELSRSNRFDRPLSVIIADLDLLRNINNTYGHLAGDAVLIGVAQAVKQSVREYDVVSRFGGEEFAILLPETTLVQAYEKAEFFRKTIEAMEFTIPTSMTPIRATMSFGVAQRENARQTSNEIVHNADLALYNSKLQGRNRTFAHTHNTYFDFPSDHTGGPGGSAGIELNPPRTYLLETFTMPPSG